MQPAGPRIAEVPWPPRPSRSCSSPTAARSPFASAAVPTNWVSAPWPSIPTRTALHRFKADEAYQVGQTGEPIKSYLDIPGIIKIRKENDVDAVHPGYGFLSENAEFAQACADNDITLIGCRLMSRKPGDKTRPGYRQAGQCTHPGRWCDGAIESGEAGLAIAEQLGFPIILKAAYGGGGRGMRVVHKSEDFIPEFEQAQRGRWPSVAVTSSPRNSSPGPGISSGSSVMRTAIWCISMSATARCKAAT